MANHAFLSPSAASRWLTCTASAELEATYPDTDTSYTAQGTVAHELAELEARKATGYIEAKKYRSERKRIEKSEFYDQEMQECAEAYGALIKDYLEVRRGFCNDAFPEFEVKLDLVDWIPGGFGTADCVIISDGILEVIDYKYGKGVPVSASNNDQMRIYALGCYAKYRSLFDIDSIEMTIFQPRLNANSSDMVSIKNLLQWGENTVKPKAKEAAHGMGQYVPSEKACRFCKAKGECRARAQMFLDMFGEHHGATLSTEEIAQILGKAKEMRSWIDDLEKTVQDNLMSGVQVPGWKMVEGRSVRKITDEAAAVKALIDSGIPEAVLYERKLISLTQMEKDFGKKAVKDILSPYIEKPAGKPCLVPESDPRDPILIDPFSDSEDIPY